MAASSKFDMSSGSPDSKLYVQRGSYAAALLDRSASFHENMENPILSTPSMSRSSSTIAQGDVVNFFQCLPFDPKPRAADNKFIRPVDIHRLICVAFGLPVDESPSGSSKGKPLPSSIEDLKQLKTVCESSIKAARERSKIFNNALSVMSKCFPSVPSRKRSRSDLVCTERSNSIFSTDRAGLGSGMGKMGTQIHAIGSGFELDPPKSEERTKIAIPNKRTRTSMVDIRTDVRANTPARPSGNVDRDREVLRIPSSATAPCEDRPLSINVDGWERSKMKKKRSGIKPDVSPSTVAAKPVDGYRETKQGMQPRLLTDARSRLNDSHGFRPGMANGTGKADGILQPASLGMRSSKADQDNNSFLHDKRDRPAALDKERVNLRAVNKTNAREDFGSATTTNTKMNSSVRGPRSSSNVFHKLSPIVQRTTMSKDWESSHCTSKVPTTVGSNNRKRTPSMRPSSPPVAHWAGQRSQKGTRTARRTNFVPIVSSNDETHGLDAMSDVAGNENGNGILKRLPSNSPQQVKSKNDLFSASALSESEESGAAEIKSGDKVKKNDEVDEKPSHNVQKVSTLVLQPRKNKLVNGDDLGDGVRRQGRSGRGFTSSRSLMPMAVEKLSNVGTAKQLRTMRLAFDKTESKAGRPPTRRLSDRKPYTRQKHSTISAATDFHVGSDNGHDELLAAAAAIVNPAHCFSSPFWRHMESFFGFISDADMDYVKQQGNLVSTVPTPVPLHVDSSKTIPDGSGLIENNGDSKETKNVELANKEIPLCQRLIAALISEEGNEELYYSGSEGHEVDAYRYGFELDTVESNDLNLQSLGKLQHTECAGFNRYRITANERSNSELECSGLDTDMVVVPEENTIPNVEYLQNGLLSGQAIAPEKACSEFQYGNMSLDEKVLLEMQSIGLYLEPVMAGDPDLTQTVDEEIGEDISRLEEKYHEQVRKKKALLGKLLSSATETREHQEKAFEHHALDKLVTMAYEKYMTYWGPHASGGKSASSKMAKQAALAFVKRTLERCQKFEDTGKNCFSEPLFRDMFHSGLSHLNDAQAGDSNADGESGKQYANTSGCFMEARVSAAMGTQQSPSPNSHDVYSSNALISINHSSSHSIGKEETWSNRGKRRELSLDDVGGIIGTSTAPSGIGNSLSSSAKGKRSERDRDGKGNSREVLSRNGTTRIGRPTSGNIKGERKSKTKPKQKTSVNGLLGKLPEQPKATLSSVPHSSETTTSGNIREKDQLRLDDSEAIDLSHLQLPGMDVLGVPDDLGGQGQDIGSWLNIDDIDGLQDHEDYNGLEIPMDDLADLNMMV